MEKNKKKLPDSIAGNRQAVYPNVEIIKISLELFRLGFNNKAKMPIPTACKAYPATVDS